VRVERASEGEEERPEVRVVERRGKTAISLPDPDKIKTRKTQRQLASAILAVFELAMKERSTEQRRATFTKLLLDLLAKW
jgi:hypothetical protein